MSLILIDYFTTFNCLISCTYKFTELEYTYSIYAHCWGFHLLANRFLLLPGVTYALIV